MNPVTFLCDHKMCLLWSPSFVKKEIFPKDITKTINKQPFIVTFLRLIITLRNQRQVVRLRGSYVTGRLRKREWVEMGALVPRGKAFAADRD